MVAFYLFLYPPQKWRRHFCDGRFFSATINPTLLSLRLGCVDKYIPQIRNYAPNMIQKRKESASLVKRGHSASNVTIKTYKCPLPRRAT